MPEPSGPDRDRPAVLQVLPRLDPDERGRNTVDVARYLRAHGWRTVVASSGGRLERELAAAGGMHVRLPLDTGSWLRVWQNARALASLMRRHRVALVHARAAGAAWSAALAARRRGIPFLTTFHALQPLRRGRPGRFHRIMTGGDRVIAVSEFVAEHLVEAYQVEPERVRLIRRWIDPDEFDPERVRGHRVAALAERWGIQPGPKVVIVPGTIASGQGHALLLDAMARMERADFILLFVGEVAPGSSFGRELLAKLRLTGLGERVRFGGSTDDLPAAFMLADVVVLPAIDPDPSGVAAVAAQAMGKPVIVTNAGALGESVLPAATGWLLPPNDRDELARALDLALSLEDDVRQRLAARSRTFVLDEFGMDAMCGRTLGVYRELIQPAARSRSILGTLAEAGGTTT